MDENDRNLLFEAEFINFHQITEPPKVTESSPPVPRLACLKQAMRLIDCCLNL